MSLLLLPLQLKADPRLQAHSIADCLPVRVIESVTVGGVQNYGVCPKSLQRTKARNSGNLKRGETLSEVLYGLESTRSFGLFG